LATPQTGLTAEQVALGHFGKINVKTHNFPPHKVRLKTKGDSDVYVIRNTFDPGGSSGWHTHVAIQILPKGAARRIDAPDPGNCPF
jgi:hypothetical protein